jgi:hypothetical protein
VYVNGADILNRLLQDCKQPGMSKWREKFANFEHTRLHKRGALPFSSATVSTGVQFAEGIIFGSLATRRLWGNGDFQVDTRQQGRGSC